MESVGRETNTLIWWSQDSLMEAEGAHLYEPQKAHPTSELAALFGLKTYDLMKFQVLPIL